MEGAHLSRRSSWITAAQGNEQEIMEAWEIVFFVFCFFFNRFLLNLQFGLFFFFLFVPSYDRIQQLPFIQHISTEVKASSSSRVGKAGKSHVRAGHGHHQRLSQTLLQTKRYQPTTRGKLWFW